MEVSALYFPAGQSVHAVAPVEAWYVPDGQTTQSDSTMPPALLVEYVPAAHPVQVVAATFRSVYEPAAHGPSQTVGSALGPR